MSEDRRTGGARTEVAGARRIVVKVGSSSLTTAAGGIDPERLHRLVDAVAAVHRGGTEVVLVSSGAIAAGLAPLGLKRRPKGLAAQQAAASVGQGLLVAQYTAALAAHAITTGQVLLTVDDVTRRSHYRNAHQTFAKLLELGVLPIVNENDTVATQEIRFGDNDRLAALVAHLVHADLLVLLSDVDGLYDGNPALPGTSLVTDVRTDDDLAGIEIGSPGAAGVGTGGMVTKVEAARIATGAGIPVVLTSAPNAAAALGGADVGTLFHATGRRRPTRLLWLRHATDAKGSLHLDAGAVRAVLGRRASLLAAGVTGASGAFHAGDPVDLVGPDGAAVARGLVNFDAEEIPRLAGRSSGDLAAELGAEYEREVVHRDDLVLL
ncbi:glutamate 5-kinase [Nocardioides sp. ChNu-153]|uniref:glutamate 5-kinase n=1 Tax=unclassified Nocardioides TaxID=2615069 RepID=UPI0024072A2E|nr:MULTISPECIES: glutamate 5-kinase [unclassified Nocardioides]MDF9715982.1 glutamate 5-kinase [Nocardioides sp. ChNu-99]MDN7119950.1 glutamate 5-kinase [Nocardioides sp. ChNu-153]